MEKRQEVMERVPVPDPTLLTTEALKTSVQALKELVSARTDSLEKYVVDKITELEKFVTDKIAAVNILKEEKFRTLHSSLDMVERHRIEAKEDDAKALELALSALKELFDQKNMCNEEAAAKAESSFSKQIEAIRKEGSIERDGLSGRLDALKERLDRGTGRDDQKGQFRDLASWLIPMIIGAIISFILVMWKS